MDFSYVLVIKSGCNCPCCLIELSQTVVNGRKGSNMLHDDLVWLSSEAEYLEAADGEHLVGVLAVINRDELVEELLLRRKECVC